MTLRDDLIPVVDGARALVGDLGLRPREVKIRTIARTGTGLAAIGTETTTDVTLEPTPRVRDSPAIVSRVTGRVDGGDVVIDQISLTYDRSDLDPPGDSVWLVGGAEYRLVQLLEPERGSSWSYIAILRRVRRDRS